MVFYYAKTMVFSVKSWTRRMYISLSFCFSYLHPDIERVFFETVSGRRSGVDHAFSGQERMKVGSGRAPERIGHDSQSGVTGLTTPTASIGAAAGF